ncbi:MAG: rRNA maturation RNase YbeY [Alphaproteobacteria bacterium]|nr:rRNA maturation RNase YbeY [Alphaproteobacteria bacterium]
MGPNSTVSVLLTCPRWAVVCPAAENLAREAAQCALIDGSAASGFAWQGRLELGVMLTDAAEQQRLNHDYRGCDAPTNVLAFPAWDPQVRPAPGAPLLLGDVVLAFEPVACEAREEHKPLADHLRHLVVHGVLHLLGYDHLSEREAAEMEALETSILAKMGVPDPYRDTMSFIESEPAKP